ITLSACGVEEQGPNLLVPDDVEIRGSDTWDAEHDRLAALVPGDVTVDDRHSGEPTPGVPLTVLGLGAEVVPADAVDLAHPADPCEDCAIWWDAWRDVYVELTEEPGSTFATETDPTGLSRVYVFVDSFLAANAGFEPVVITVSAAHPAG